MADSNAEASPPRFSIVVFRVIRVTLHRQPLLNLVGNQSSGKAERFRRIQPSTPPSWWSSLAESNAFQQQPEKSTEALFKNRVASIG
jgi:hypothetical protein